MSPSSEGLTIPSASADGAGRISKTVAYYAAFVALGLATAALGPTLPDLAKRTGTTLPEVSLLFVAHSLGYLLGSVLGGRWYDRTAGHPVMVVTLATMALMMALVPVMSWLPFLIAVLLVLGAAQGALDVGGNTLLVWVHRHRVAPFMNGLHFFFGVGAFLSPAIIVQVVRVSGDIRWAYWVLALLMPPVAGWLLRLSSPAQETASTDVPEARVDYPLVALIAVFFFLCVAAETSFGGWVFTYSVALDLSTGVTAAYLTSAFWGAFTLGRLLAIPAAARFRPRSILLGDLVGCLVSACVIWAWPSSLTAIWLGAIGYGLSLASVFATTLCLAESRMTINGKVTGWFLVGSSAGSMSLPWLIGQLFESIGPQVFILAIVIDIIVAVGVLFVIDLYSTRSVTEH